MSRTIISIGLVDGLGDFILRRRECCTCGVESIAQSNALSSKSQVEAIIERIVVVASHCCKLSNLGDDCSDALSFHSYHLMRV